MLFANVCARSICYSYWWTLVLGLAYFWVFLLLLGVLYLWGLLVLVASHYVQDLGYFGVPQTGHALWAWFGWSITFLASCENAWQLIKLHIVFELFQVYGNFMHHKSYMQALAYSG